MERIDRRCTREDGTEKSITERNDTVMDKLDEIVEKVNELEKKMDKYQLK